MQRFAIFLALLACVGVFLMGPEFRAYAQATSSGGGCSGNCTFTGATTVTTLAGADAGFGYLNVSIKADVLALDAGTIVVGSGSSGAPQISGRSGDVFISVPSGVDEIHQDNGGSERARIKAGGQITATEFTANTDLHINTDRAIGTCDSSQYGRIYLDNTGNTGGKWTKVCICTKDGTNYKWINLVTATGAASQTGNTTTCQDS